MRIIPTLAAALGLAIVASNARAALVAGDSYLSGSDVTVGQYPSGTALSNAAVLGTAGALPGPGVHQLAGFTTGRYGAGTGSSQFAATSGGLANVGAQSTNAGSGKVSFLGVASADNTPRSAARTLSPAALASGTYWIAHVVNRGNNTLATGTGFVLTGFGNAIEPTAGTTSAALAGLFVGFAQDGVANNFGNLVIRYRDTAGNTSADAVLINGATTSTFGTSYLVVAKIDVNASGATDAVTWWLNPTNGASESLLSATATSTGTFNSFALQGSTDFVRLNYTTRNYTGTAFFDEARLSTDLAGLSLAVPEPTTLAALAGLGVTLIRRRRA